MPHSNHLAAYCQIDRKTIPRRRVLARGMVEWRSLIYILKAL
jgi:hypothetical protein